MKVAPPSGNQMGRNYSVSGLLGEALGARQPKTEMMTYQGGADEVAGFLALPPVPGRHRAVIAIHEWWGLTGWVKEQATNLASMDTLYLPWTSTEGESQARYPKSTH